MPTLPAPSSTQGSKAGITSNSSPDRPASPPRSAQSLRAATLYFLPAAYPTPWATHSPVGKGKTSPQSPPAARAPLSPSGERGSDFRLQPEDLISEMDA